MKYTEQDEQRFIGVLKEIQSRIPEGLRKTVVKERKLSPVVEKVMLEAVKTDSIDPEKRQQIQNILDSGMVSKTAIVENERIAKQIDNFVMREINKAIKAGRLPPRSQIKNLPSMLKYEKKD